MKNKNLRLILTVVVVIIVIWLLIKFISGIPFWVWLLVVGILVYLNWARIKKMF